jgi:hypothetical protein
MAWQIVFNEQIRELNPTMNAQLNAIELQKFTSKYKAEHFLLGVLGSTAYDYSNIIEVNE